MFVCLSVQFLFIFILTILGWNGQGWVKRGSRWGRTNAEGWPEKDEIR